MWPYFDPDDKIEQYFSVQGTLQELKWKKEGTYEQGEDFIEFNYTNLDFVKCTLGRLGVDNATYQALSLGNYYYCLK